MVIAAFIFSIAVFAFSLLFLLRYIQNDKYMRVNGARMARQRQQQLESQAGWQARLEAERRAFEEARRALLEQAGKKDDEEEGRDAQRRDIEHAA